MKFVKLFQKHDDSEGDSGYVQYHDSSDYVTPNLSLCLQESHLHIEPEDSEQNQINENLRNGCLTFNIENGEQFQIALSKVGSPDDIPTLVYAINGGNWSDYTMGDSITVTTNENQKCFIQMKMKEGYTCSGLSKNNSNYYKFQITGSNVYCKGNIMSICGYKNEDIQLKPYAFYGLFSACTALKTYPTLPSITLGNLCYANMFIGCTSLVSGTTSIGNEKTLAVSGCCTNMFYGCTNLLKTPELPANTLRAHCYNGMFMKCTNLKNAPSLPAEYIDQYSYANMFRESGILNPPRLDSIYINNGCYASMFKQCTSLKSFPDLPAATLPKQCYTEMFNGTRIDGKSFYVGFTSIDIFATSGWFNSYYTDFYYDNHDNARFRVNTIKRNKYAKSTTPQQFNVPSGFTIEEEQEEISNLLTFEGVESSNSVKLFISGTSRSEFSAYTPEIKYRINNGTWNNYTITNYSGLTISLNQNDKVQFSGYLHYAYPNSGLNITRRTCAYRGWFYKFAMTGKIKGSGNISSIFDLNGIGGVPIGDGVYRGEFHYLFSDCQALVTAPEFPPTRCTDAYAQTFASCINLTTPPSKLIGAWGQRYLELPSSACFNTFYNCQSLQQTPILPNILVNGASNGAYGSMFMRCYALSAAPELPSKTLALYCYQQMFNNCQNLQYIKAMFTTAPSTSYTNNWVSYNTPKNGTFVMNEKAEWNPENYTGNDVYYGIPNGWEVIKESE